MFSITSRTVFPEFWIFTLSLKFRTVKRVNITDKHICYMGDEWNYELLLNFYMNYNGTMNFMEIVLLSRETTSNFLSNFPLLYAGYGRN